MLKIHHTEHFSNTIRIGKYNTDTKEVVCEETGETYPSTTLFAMDHYKKSYGKPEWERVMLRSKDWDVCMIEVEPEVRWISSNHLEMYNLTQRVKHLECQLSLLMKNTENKNKEESKEENVKENEESKENKNIHEENKEESKENKNIHEENKEESKEENVKENEESKENKKDNSDEESKEENVENIKEDKPKGKGKDKSKKNKEVNEVKENIKDIRDIKI